MKDFFMAYFESFDGTKIHYEAFAGKKPQTIFFLHGWTAQAEYYYFLKEYLADYHLIFWDARCHGQSQVRENATVKDMAEDFKFFLDRVNPFDFPLTAVGHSMGALTLFEYFSRHHTHKVSKLVIVDQSPKLVTDAGWDLGVYGHYTPEMNLEMIRRFIKDVGEGVIYLNGQGLNETYRNLFQKHPETLLQRKRSFTPEANTGLVSIWETLTQADYRPVLKTINIPTLLLYGEKSQYYLKETAVFVRDQIQAPARIVYFKKGDHSPFVQHPKEFCAELSQFVSEIF